MITYETKACKTVIDFFLIRKSERKLVRDVKVVHEECIRLQYFNYDMTSRKQHKYHNGTVTTNRNANRLIPPMMNCIM